MSTTKTWYMWPMHRAARVFIPVGVPGMGDFAYTVDELKEIGELKEGDYIIAFLSAIRGAGYSTMTVVYSKEGLQQALNRMESGRLTYGVFGIVNPLSEALPLFMDKDGNTLSEVPKEWKLYASELVAADRKALQI